MDTIFSVDKANGTASFTSLEKTHGVKNYMTFDNSVWGNMNPVFETSEVELQRIEANDQKLKKIVGDETYAVSKTPSD